jgi:biopolymer transport protein ExbD
MQLDIAPLIDCVFLLLIFFMLSSSFSNPAIRLQLPTATTRDAADTREVVVSIDRDGAVFVDHTPVSLDGLQAALEKILGPRSEKRVLLRGDQNLRYSVFIEVLDLAERAGATAIDLAHSDDGDAR